jgi:hypothetical protein
MKFILRYGVDRILAMAACFAVYSLTPTGDGARTVGGVLVMVACVLWAVRPQDG